MLLFKKVLKVLKKSTKHANFWRGVQYPLNSINVGILLTFTQLKGSILNPLSERSISSQMHTHIMTLKVRKTIMIPKSNFLFPEISVQY